MMKNLAKSADTILHMQDGVWVMLSVSIAPKATQKRLRLKPQLLE